MPGIQFDTDLSLFYIAPQQSDIFYLIVIFGGQCPPYDKEVLQRKVL
jgi:hypothetical protein